MEAIQYKGLDQLSEEQRAVLDKLAAEYYGKIQRAVHNASCSIVIHLKKYQDKGGGKAKEKKREKFSIQVLTVAPTKTFESSAFDWDFARTLHKALGSMVTELEHHFKRMLP